MLRTLRTRLTLICVISTGIILSIMSVFLLIMAEKQMNIQSSVTFQNNVNSVVYRLQSGNTIDSTWLAQVESGNDLIIHLEDNGQPLLFSGSWRPKTSRSDLIAAVQETALVEHSFDVKLKPYSIIDVSSAYFEITGEHGDRYQAATVSIPSSRGWQSVTMLRSIDKERNLRLSLRIVFACSVTGAIALLLLFSLWFSKRAIEPIERSNQKQVEFVAAASHELRSPLAVVRAAISTLKVADKRQDIDKYSAIADRECVRMSRLIDDLLLLASADAKTWSIKTRAVELDTLLMNLYEGFESVAQKKGLGLTLSLPDESLPEVMGDSHRLAQALTVLLDNACSYTPQNGTITLSITTSKKYVDIHVADNGPGIPDEVKEQVFDRFFRADASHSKKEHYGLGLSIAREIAVLHQGRLLLSDTPGGGATFTLRLPTTSA